MTSRVYSEGSRRATNPLRIRISKTQDSKPFRICIYKKTGGGGCLSLVHRELRPVEEPNRTSSLSTTYYSLSSRNNVPAPTSNNPAGKCAREVPNGRNV